MSRPDAGDEARSFRQFSVRTYECDTRGRLRLEALLNYLQDSAAEHAERLGAGVVDLIKRNLTWVLSRYHIRISRYPGWKESVELATWPSLHQGLFALREFEVRDGQGTLIAAASSSWMLIDLKTKRPVAPGERLGPYPRDPRRAVGSNFEPLPAVGQGDIERSFRVRLSDLDWNRHVNHVATIAWALETPAADFLEKHHPVEIEVDFRGQAFFGESALCRMQELSSGQDTVTLIRIIKEQNERELARLRIRWNA
ncbi:MAG: acyl-ACP thioesterase [Candidatus Aminicenantes bacterium]|nr:acyl-ACP thioesterase [Candidatus Aminicenantes bacterium]